MHRSYQGRDYGVDRKYYRLSAKESTEHILSLLGNFLREKAVADSAAAAQDMLLCIESLACRLGDPVYPKLQQLQIVALFESFRQQAPKVQVRFLSDLGWNDSFPAGNPLIWCGLNPSRSDYQQDLHNVATTIQIFLSGFSLNGIFPGKTGLVFCCVQQEILATSVYKKYIKRHLVSLLDRVLGSSQVGFMRASLHILSFCWQDYAQHSCVDFGMIHLEQGWIWVSCRRLSNLSRIASKPSWYESW